MSIQDRLLDLSALFQYTKDPSRKADLLVGMRQLADEARRTNQPLPW